MLCAFWNKPEFPNTKGEKRNSHVHLDNQNLRNMWAVWILLCAVCFTGSNAANPVTIEVLHGKPLNIRLSSKSDIVEFTAHNKTETVILYPKSSSHLRGNVKEVKKDWDFVIDSVIFEDRGIYRVKNSRNILSNVYKVKVFSKIGTYKHVAGETLSIGLDGLKLGDVSMMFSRADFNLTLVTRGSPVGNAHPDYQGRIQVTSDSIKILKVNVSDQGNYTLTDGLNRKFNTARLILTEKQKLSALGALLLLLGIPAGVCCYCCCCKDKSKDSNKADTNTSPEDGVKLESTNSPAEPQPASNNPVAPAAPTMMYPGYPPADGGTVYPPPQAPYSVNPAMPSNPAFSPMYPPMPGYPPAHPSQWAGAPYNQPTTEISSASPLLPPTQP